MSKPTLDELWSKTDSEILEECGSDQISSYCAGRDDLARVILERLDEIVQSAYVYHAIGDLVSELRSKLDPTETVK